MFSPLDNERIPTPDLSAMTSTSWGSAKSEGRKKKVLEEVYLKCDKGICMDLTKTKGQRRVGRAGREWDIQTSTKADGKGAGLGPALESGQLGCCGAGCWGLTRGNMQLLMGKALCGQHGQNLVVCLSKK